MLTSIRAWSRSGERSSIKHARFLFTPRVFWNFSATRGSERRDLTRQRLYFVTPKGTKLTQSVAEWTFNKIALACGLRKVSRRGPRIHDLRHTFVVKTLESWYRAEKDVEALLPVLSTYVGHAQPASTFWNMSITPELMALARRRRDRYLGGLSQ